MLENMSWEEEIMGLGIDDEGKKRIIGKIKADIERREVKIAKLDCMLACEREAKASTPLPDWYEKQHDQDLNKIKRLNTTVDTLIEKIGVMRTIIEVK